MPKNLSRATASPSIEHFYTAIHAQMTKRGKEKTRPTMLEFAKSLDAYPIPPGALALDAGCGGTGDLTLAYVRKGFHSIYAIDLNEQNLLLARSILAAHPAAPVQLSCASVLNLPFPSGLFDFVACLGVAHHTPSPEQVISELARVLKPNGTFYFSVYCFADSAFEWIVRFLRWFGIRIPFRTLHGLLAGSLIWNNFVMDHMYVPVLWLFRAEEVRHLLKSHGLTIQREWPSQMDPFRGYGRFAPYLSGDGLMRVWLCQKV